MKRKCDEMREKVLDYAQLFSVYFFTQQRTTTRKNMSGNKTKKTKREKFSYKSYRRQRKE